MITNKKIGVLGGIGPEASSEFYSKLIRRLQEKGLVKSNRDFPQILINSIPAPELIYDEISQKELGFYINGLKELDQLEVDFIVMVCNTIHLFYDALQKGVSKPIIDIRKELKNLLIEKNIKSVLILGTPATIKQGLYKFEGIKSFEPNEEEMKQLAASIFNFNRGAHKQMQVDEVKKICYKYLDQGAEIIVLGCTELAVMLNDENISLINTIDVMVEATIKRLSTFP